MPGKLFAGTSGFAYKEWKPEFYPADLKNDAMLGYYAERLPSVEINYTYYREPAQKTIDTWRERTPDGFMFALKANKKITHDRRLGDVDDVLERFLGTVKALGDRLGPVLFQCPPTLKYDEALLDAFLARLPAGDMPDAHAYRFAMEFRNATWENDAVYDKLASNNVAWCVSDTDERDAPMRATSKELTYLRLRKFDYPEDSLKAWAGHVRRYIDGGGDAFVYFKHEDTASGVLFALKFRELVENG